MVVERKRRKRKKGGVLYPNLNPINEVKETGKRPDNVLKVNNSSI
jgi:hypothetical protein